jgi:hypothetical protein
MSGAMIEILIVIALLLDRAGRDKNVGIETRIIL